MEVKLAQPLISRAQGSATYCARVDVENAATLVRVASVVLSKCPTILFLCSCGASSLEATSAAPHALCVTVVAAWPHDMRVPHDFHTWIDRASANVVHAHKVDLSLHSDDMHCRVVRFDFAADKEHFPEKAVDQLIANANAQLKKWNLVVDDDEDEREYTFDDI